MRFFLAIQFSILLSLLTMPAALLAAPDIGVAPGGAGLTGEIAGKSGYTTAVTEFTLSETVGRIIHVALSLVGTIFFALIVYSGYLWMTAGGNEEKISQATGLVKTGVIGVIIILAAYSLTNFVVTRVIGSTQAPAPQVGR